MSWLWRTESSVEENWGDFEMPPQPKYGEWAFLAGVIIAVLLGLFALFAVNIEQQLIWIYGVLALFGLIVGLLNIREKETTAFLVAAIALTIGTTTLDALEPLKDALPFVEEPLSKFIAAIVVFVAPAAFIVALKAIYSLAKKI